MAKTRNGLTMKQDRFITETIRTANPTEAVSLVYDVKDRLVARSIASENLTKPDIQNELRQRMIANGVNADHLIRTQKRTLDQTDNLPASNTALDMFYKILGAYAPEKKLTVNVDLTADDNALQDEIKAIQERLAKMDDTTVVLPNTDAHIQS